MQESDPDTMPSKTRAEVHPLLEFAGMFDPDDSLVQEWLEIMREERDRDDPNG
jgi:hypothetical protein